MSAQTDLIDYLAQRPRFDGPADDIDARRLTGQILRIHELISDGRWRTLAEIEAETGDPQASISAQLRNLRKARFGSHTIERRRRGPGTYEYRLAVQQ